MSIDDKLLFAHEFGHLVYSNYPELPQLIEELPAVLMQYHYVESLEGHRKVEAETALEKCYQIEVSKRVDGNELNGRIDLNGRLEERYYIGHVISQTILNILEQVGLELSPVLLKNLYTHLATNWEFYYNPTRQVFGLIEFANFLFQSCVLSGSMSCSSNSF